MRNKMISIHAGWLVDGSGDAAQPKMRHGTGRGDTVI
jgi:hypothetical protein